MPPDRPINLMVSSSVLGIEELLDQVYSVLTTLGYNVWMSHKGTIPVAPHLSALDSCLQAVEQCDAFLGIITGRYGSGKQGDDLAITHREMLRAVELDKVRFFAVHENVRLARVLLDQFRADATGIPHHHSFFKRTAVLDDIRILDMYDHVIRDGLPLGERTGNWAQAYRTSGDLLLFVNAQFADQDRIKNLIQRGGGNAAQ